MTTFSDNDDSYDEIDKKLRKVWRNAAGERHRYGDLPAVIMTDGSVSYFRYGELHRDGDLPAVIYADGTVVYYKDGKKHRDGDLPAVIWANGSEGYWIDGVLQVWQK